MVVFLMSYACRVQLHAIRDSIRKNSRLFLEREMVQSRVDFVPKFGPNSIHDCKSRLFLERELAESLVDFDPRCQLCFYLVQHRIAKQEVFKC